MHQAWYVQINGKARPSTRAEIDHLLATGILDDDSLVWTEGMAGWVPYGESTLAKPIAPATPPPLPPPPQVPLPAATPDSAKPTVEAFKVERQVVQRSDERVITPPRLEVSDDGWQDTSPAPWRRYFARTIDVLAMGMAAWFVMGFVLASSSTSAYDSWVSSEWVKNPVLAGIVTCALVIPLTTLLIGLTGSTLGKWIFGVRVTRRDGRPIGMGAAFGRELTVFFAGMGLGIPLIALFTQISAYKRLNNEGVTSWDRDQAWVVTHRPRNAWQIALYVMGTVLLFMLVAIVQAMK